MNRPTGKLTRLAFSGYKSFYDETTLEPRDLNILIGANQSGKSAILDLLDLLHQASARKLQTGISARGGIDNLLSWDGANGLSLRLTVDGDAEHLKSISYELKIVSEFFRAKIRGEKFDGIEIHSDSFRQEFSRVSPGYDENELSLFQVSALGRESDNGARFSCLLSFLQSIAVHQTFNTSPLSPMRSPEFIGAHISGLPPTRLAPGGDNLTSVLYLIAHEPKYRDALEELEFMLRRAFPTFKRLTFPPISQGKTIVSWEDERASRAIPATFLSDGTLRYMCLLAALYDPEPPALLCIDEPEIGLHPDMLRLLAAAIEESAAQTQIVISTHSPDLLSYLPTHSQIIVCESENGRSRAVQKSPDELKRWLEVYSLGELWKQGELGGLM